MQWCKHGLTLLIKIEFKREQSLRLILFVSEFYSLDLRFLDCNMKWSQTVIVHMVDVDPLLNQLLRYL